MFDRQALAEGLELLAAGDRVGAEKCLLEIGPFSPQRGPAMAALGRMYLDDGRLEEAVACLIEAVNHLHEARVYKDLGDCLILLGRHPEAEAALREALQSEPGDPEAWAMLGRALISQDRDAEGIVVLERAVALDGAFAAARYFLASALIRSGDTVRATGQLHMLLALDPGNVAAAVLKGDLAFNRAEYRQAVQEYSRAEAQDALDAGGYERLGQAREALGDVRGAVLAYERAAPRDPKLARCWLAAARLCETQKLLRRARGYFRQALAWPSCEGEASEGLARIEDYYSHFDLSGQGGALPADDQVESVDDLPSGQEPPQGPRPPPARFGRR